jgi:hypothetical protein
VLHFDTGQTGGRRLDAAQYDHRTRSYYFKHSRPEIIMTALPEPATAIVEPSAADAATRIAKAHKQSLDFMFGAQKIILEEMVFASNEMLDRARTETHLLSEFVSKVAGSHSVKDLKTMWQ